jgi:hypothetical protein
MLTAESCPKHTHTEIFIVCTKNEYLTQQMEYGPGKQNPALSRRELRDDVGGWYVNALPLSLSLSLSLTHTHTHTHTQHTHSPGANSEMM